VLHKVMTDSARTGYEGRGVGSGGHAMGEEHALLHSGSMIGLETRDHQHQHGTWNMFGTF
jgi:hypothetical protein